ncbi:hypothetical protein KJ763_00305 [Patescibacteria group bacterium]|nr:hypothetical protein [Patescibacteria group bacterium]
MNRKILILGGVVLILIIIAGIIWIFSGNDGETPNNNGGFLSGFFPSGGDRDINGDGSLFPNGDDNPQGYLNNANLFKLSQSAVSGLSTATTSIKYIEKSTGHIFEINPDGQNRNRISNTTILKSFESFWSTDGNSLIVRYLEDSGDYFNIRNFSGSFSASTSLEGIFLPNDIKSLVVSPEEKSIFYLIPSGDSNIGLTASFLNEKKKQIISIPFGEFNVSWPSKNIISFNTKPSAEIEGHVYFLNLKTGGFNKIFGDIKGLVSLVSPDASKILFSQTSGKRIISKIYDIDKKTESGFWVNTIPDKCVWSKKEKGVIYCGTPNSLPNADYPDEWYQGLVSFNDSLWKINIDIGESILVAPDLNMDMINLSLTPDEDYLVFINKKDNTLFSLKLEE